MATIAETPEVIPTSISTYSTSSDTTSSSDETTSSSDDDTSSTISVKKSSDKVEVTPKEKSSDNVSKKKTTSSKSSPSKSSLKKTSSNVIEMTEDAPKMAHKRAQPKKVKMSGSPRSPKLLPPGTTVYIQNEPREDQGGCCGRRKKSKSTKTQDNVSPLAEAALFGDLDRISKKAKSHNINVTKDKDKDYKSNDVGANSQPPLHQYPLHLAMQGCHPGAVRLLLEKGANISLEQDLARENIFHVAAFHSNNEGAKEAIDWAGANGKLGEVEKLLNPTDLSTMITSPLLAAVVYGNYELVDLYIRAGANPQQTDKHGRSTLELAVFWNESWHERVAAGYEPTRQGISNVEVSKRYESYPKIITLLREKLGLSEEAIATTIDTAEVVDYISSSSSSSSSASTTTTTSSSVSSDVTTSSS